MLVTHFLTTVTKETIVSIYRPTPNTVTSPPVTTVTGTNADFHLAVESYYEARKQDAQVERFQASLAGESFSGINENNRHIYIGYVKSMAKGLGVKLPEGIDDISNPVILSRTLAGEGLIGETWEEIKKMFTNLMRMFTDLLKRIFTRAGRLKARIEGIRETLKNRPELKLAQISPETVPDGLKHLFPSAANISVGSVQQGIGRTDKILTNFLLVVKSFELLAYSGVIEPSKVKGMQELIRKKNTTIENVRDKAEINANTKSGLFSNKEKKESEKNLKAAKTELEAVSKEKKNARDALDKDLDRVNDPVVDENGGLIDDKFEDDYKKAVEKINGFMDGVAKLELIGGKTILVNATEKEHGIPKLEMEKSDVKHDDATVTLSDTKTVSGVLSSALEILNKSQTLNDTASKVMEHFANAFTSIDNAIAAITANEKTDRKISGGDAKTEGKLSTYKGLAEKSVKPFLKKLQDSFVIFSKLTSTFIELSMDTCDAAVDYSLLCMKYYK